MTRFETHLGCNYDPAYVAGLSDEELIELLEFPDYWDADLLRDLVWRATVKDERLEDLLENDELNMSEIFEIAVATLKDEV